MKQDIIEMARQVGLCRTQSKFDDWIDAGPCGYELEHFARLVAAKEREAAVRAERQRIVNLLMIQHEAANGAHNYWHVAANLIQSETGEQA